MSQTPDPSDKLDAQADGAFGGKPINRRAGYGDRLEMALRFAKKGACLSAGEGQLIVEHYESLLEELRGELSIAHLAIEQQIKIVTELQEDNETLKDALESAEQDLETLRDSYVEDCEELEKERDTLRRILAALRDPSEAVSDAAFESFYGVDMPKSLTWAIRAAVAAAEKEINNG